MAANLTSPFSPADLMRARYTPAAPAHYCSVQLQPTEAGVLPLDLQAKPARGSRAGILRQKFTHRVQHPNSRYSTTPSSLDHPPASAASVQLPVHKALAARLAAAAAMQASKQQQQHEYARSVTLASDIAIICEELGLTQAAAAALTAAALKRKVSANPGILLCQIARLLPLDDALGGMGSVDKLLTSFPTFVQHDPNTLLQNIAALQSLLDIQDIETLISKQPQLLTYSPFALQTNFAKLQGLLGWTPAAAAAAAADQPVLLQVSPGSLQQRLDVLRNKLFAAVPEDVLLKHLRRCPELLLLRASTIAAKLQCLQAVFQQPEVAACTAAASKREPSAGAAQTATAEVAPQQQQQQHMVQSAWQCRHQEYVGEGSQKLAAALARLNAAAATRQGMSLTWQQHARHQHWPHQQHPAQQSLGSSSNSDACVQQLVLKAPGLLCLSPTTLQHHVTELQLLLGLQPHAPALQRIIQLQPGLLTQAPATLANKLQLLQHLTGRSECAVQEMVLKCPAVLTLSISNITSTWQMLSSCIACCKEWQQQLQKASHVTVAMALCYNEKRLKRLQLVIQLCMEHGALHQHSSSCSDIRCVATDRGGTAATPTSSVSSSRSNSSKGRKSSKASAAVLQAVQDTAGYVGAQKPRKPQKVGLAAVPWRVIIQESDEAFKQRYDRLAACWRKQQSSSSSDSHGTSEQ